MSDITKAFIMFGAVKFLMRARNTLMARMRVFRRLRVRGEIYKGMREDVRRGDLHSANLDRLRNSISKGAALKLEAGEITGEQHNGIKEILNMNELRKISPYRPTPPELRAVPVS